MNDQIKVEKGSALPPAQEALLASVGVTDPAALATVRRLMAVAWDEAILHVENFVGGVTKRAAIRDNPYRADAS